MEMKDSKLKRKLVAAYEVFYPKFFQNYPLGLKSSKKESYFGKVAK